VNLHTSLSAVRRRSLQKTYQRLAVTAVCDRLFRHLGAGRIAGWANLEELADRVGGPHDIELFQCFGEVVAGCGGDAPPKNAVQRGARAITRIGAQRVAGRAVLEQLGAAITSEFAGAVLRDRRRQRRTDGFPTRGGPSGGSAYRCRL